MNLKQTPQYEAFTVLQHWEPLSEVLPPEKMVSEGDPLYPLFSFLYNKTIDLYRKLPPRKNGENSFLHPINIVWELKKAKITDTVTLCAGLIHDYIEEEVDLHKDKEGIKEDQNGKKVLDEYEVHVTKNLGLQLTDFCKKQGISPQVAATIIESARLLTNHKRHFYLLYLCQIFECPSPEMEELAIQVKLADRTHNILSIECFNEQQRLYQCFKSLFILNNAKHFLLRKYGPGVFTNEHFSSTERLFNKCAKATYDAFLTICHITAQKGMKNVKSMIQLAFKKFALEKKGLHRVTDVDSSENHPLRLFQGIVRKYDHRLHHEWQQFDNAKKSELDYCAIFFADFKFTAEELKAVIDYKDAYAMKETVARLLYEPTYAIEKFLCSDLSRKGRIKRRMRG